MKNMNYIIKLFVCFVIKFYKFNNKTYDNLKDLN